jgi:hypothetical protein
MLSGSFYFIQLGKSVKDKFLFTITAYTSQTRTTLGQMCADLWDSQSQPVVITDWNRTRVFSDASSTAMQCLRPLRCSGAQDIPNPMNFKMVTVRVKIKVSTDPTCILLVAQQHLNLKHFLKFTSMVPMGSGLVFVKGIGLAVQRQ